MTRRSALPLLTILGALSAGPTAALADDPLIDSKSLETARTLVATGLESDLAYRITESLTTEVGPRLAGTAQEARARSWGLEKLRELGFENVRIESFPMDVWTRGETVHEDATIVAPYPQPLYATSLGGGAATPPGGIVADVVFFENFDMLLAFDESENALAGKLVFVNDRMTAGRAGEGYGWANRKRRDAWHQAEDRGAAGVLIRSVGTSTHRFAHTGMMGFPEGRRPEIPALAVSAPDADQVERMHEAGHTVRIRIETHGGWETEGESGNVIAEVIGSEAPEEIVVIGAHLDSWDTGTGALDDGAGIGIVTAAAKLIAQLPERPRRTIRVVFFGAEEVGLVGARAYAKARMEDGTVDAHVMGTESDFGARRIWSLTSNVGEHALPFINAIQVELEGLGIERGDNEGGGGPDMIPMQRLGMPVVRLQQNGEDYFDYHHTPNDTFDKIDPEEMAQNVAAWAALVWLIADSDVDFRKPSEERAAPAG